MLWTGVGIALVSVVVVAIGAMLPKGHVASAARALSAPPSTVFAIVTDVARYAEWRTDVKAVDLVSASPLRWRERGANGVVAYEMREQHPPDRLVVGIADPTLPFGGTWTYELQQTAAGTHLAITERGEVRSPVFRFVSRFFLSQTATLERFLSDLERRVRR